MAATEADVAAARKQTMEALKALGVEDLRDSDVSYITAELLDNYRDARPKRSDCSPENADASSAGFQGFTVYPCWIGNSPVHLQGVEWAYQNNNSGDGCDRAEHLCGTGNRWRAPFHTMRRNRHCQNGLEGVLGWRQGENPD